MSKIYNTENCNNPARYGLVNPETGMFENHHCKIHKENGEIGQPPKWQFRYNYMKIITANRNIKLLDSEEEFIEKTTKDGNETYLNLKCNICNDNVNTTSIARFIDGRFGCNCNKILHIIKDFQKFLNYVKIEILIYYILNKNL